VVPTGFQILNQIKLVEITGAESLKEVISQLITEG
jgi:hypothetical protein